MAHEPDLPIVNTLCDETIVAVVRLASESACLPVARALVDGGVHVIEMTMTTPGAEGLIRRVREELPTAIVGAGSVLTHEQVDACSDAGAHFLVSPILDRDLLQYALGNGLTFCPGTLTPTEAFTAWQLGARLVKVFPAARMGPKLLSDLKAPMPFLRLMPTGGINAETIGRFLDAGADAVGAGSWLMPRDAIAEERFDVVQERARQLRSAVERWRDAHGDEVAES